MVFNKWTSEEEAFCEALLKDAKTPVTLNELGEIFRIRHLKKHKGFETLRSANAIMRKIKRNKWPLPSQIASGLTVPDAESSSDALETKTVSKWAMVSDIVKKHKVKCEYITRGIMPIEQHARKILSLSDIHFPLAEPQFLTEAVITHSDADILVLNGDILEGYMFSTFEKDKRYAVLDEYRIAFEFVESMSKIFPKVVLIDGNHDVRAARALKLAGFGEETSQIFRPNLIARIANGEKLSASGQLVEKLNFSNVIYEHNESWYIKIGKTLFVHPHTHNNGPLGACVKKQAHRFNMRYPSEEVDSIVCGHTHQIYKGIVDNQLLIEQGCMTTLLTYGWSAKSEYLGTAQNGYAVIYQDEDGNTDFNRSGPIYLGQSVPPKKSITL